MKFVQLIQHNIGNTFFEKSFIKCAGEVFPDPFLKNQNRTHL